MGKHTSQIQPDRSPAEDAQHALERGNVLNFRYSQQVIADLKVIASYLAGLTPDQVQVPVSECIRWALQVIAAHILRQRAEDVAPAVDGTTQEDSSNDART